MISVHLPREEAREQWRATYPAAAGRDVIQSAISWLKFCQGEWVYAADVQRAYECAVDLAVTHPDKFATWLARRRILGGSNG